MKALDEYILMVVFVLLLKRVHFLVNETVKFTPRALLLICLCIHKLQLSVKLNDSPEFWYDKN